MAITNTMIADLIATYGERELGQLIAKYARDRSRLIKAGLAVSSDELESLRSGSRAATVTYINPLDTSFNVGTDDLTEEGNVEKLSATTYQAQRFMLNKAIGSADLVQASLGFNDELLIEELFAEVQLAIDETIGLASLKGAILAGGASVSYTTAANQPMYDAIVTAQASAGEFATQFDTVIANSVNVAKMRTVGKDYPFVRAKDSGADFDMWGGMKVITSEVFGNDIVTARGGLFAYANGTPTGFEAFEKGRMSNGANGMGGDIYHSRWATVIHPQGFGYKGAIGSKTPLTVVDKSASWERKVDVELVPFRLIKPAA